MGLNHDPRYFSITALKHIQESLDSCIAHSQVDRFLTKVSQNLLPQTDFLCTEAIRVSKDTTKLWRIVVAHMDLLFDMIRTYDFREGIQNVVAV